MSELNFQIGLYVDGIKAMQYFYPNRETIAEIDLN